jgi:hypothetical protein
MWREVEISLALRKRSLRTISVIYINWEEGIIKFNDNIYSFSLGYWPASGVLIKFNRWRFLFKNDPWWRVVDFWYNSRN